MNKTLKRLLLPALAAGCLLAGPAWAGESSEKDQHIYLHIVPAGQGVTVQVEESPALTETPAAKADACTVTAPPCETPAGEQAPGGEKSKAALMGLLFFVFVLACFLGFELIAKVPSQLHTPLMSGSNAISGITIVGALISAGTGHNLVTVVFGVLAVALAMINVAGGYVVTDRMLEMFKSKGGKK